MKLVLVSLLMLSAQMSMAATAGDFMGQYHLESETALSKNSQPICSDSLDLSLNGNAMSVVTMVFNVTAEINGPTVALQDSSRAGDFNIIFANDVLSFNSVGALPAFLSPNEEKYQEVISLELAAEADKINVHHVFSSDMPDFNYESQCVYSKIESLE